METILARLTRFVRKVSIRGADKAANTYCENSRPSNDEIKYIRVADSALSLILKVSGDVLLEQFESINYIGLRAL